MSADSQYPLRYYFGDLELYVHDAVIDILDKSRQLSPGSVEKFGILIGTKSAERDAYWVESVTTPAREDHSTRVSFTMQSSYHQEQLNAHFSNSNGKQIYLGTWHTHPEASPTPSCIDRRDWRQCERRNRGRQLFFIIVGTRDLSVFIKHRLSYVPMKVAEKSS